MLLPLQSALAAQTRSFVLNYFYAANYYGEDTCPQGLNPLPDVFFKRDLKILGVPQAKVDAMFNKDYNIQNGRTTTGWVASAATRGNGHDNVYLYPTTVPDAHLKPAVGRLRVWLQSRRQRSRLAKLLRRSGDASQGRQQSAVPHHRMHSGLQGLSASSTSARGRVPLGLRASGDGRLAHLHHGRGSQPRRRCDGEHSRASIDPVKTQDANAHVQTRHGLPGGRASCVIQCPAWEA